jgi:hypothetical protein
MFFSKFHKSKGVMRWFALICGLLFFTTAYFQGEIKEAIVAFSIGMLCGFSIDLIGVKKFHFWNYPRQPFWGKKYFAIVVPAWGVFGLTINLFWDWLNIPWLSFVVLTIGLFGLYELPNLKTNSWKYNTPVWLIGIGWWAQILYFRIIFEIIRI